MTLTINKKVIVQYILIYLMLIWHDAGIVFLIGRDLSRHLILVVCLILMLLKQRCRSQRMLWFVLAILLDVIFVRCLSGGVGINYVLNAFSGIAIAYTAFKYDKENFVDRFVKTVVFFAATSVICWLITNIAPSIFERLTVLSYSPYSNRIYTTDKAFTLSPVYYHGVLLYVMRTGNELIRNNGIYNEPGLYQMVLNTALFFVLFFPEQLKSRTKKQKKFILILIIAIITCQSTTGYLSLGALLIGYLVTQRKNEKKMKIGRYIIVALFILLGDLMINQDTSVIGQVVGGKITISSQGIEFATSGLARANTASIVFSNILKSPFGCGFDTINNIFASVGKRSADGAALIYDLAALGIQIWLILVCFVIVPAYKAKKNMITFVLIVFMYINTTMGQSDLFYPALLILTFNYQLVDEFAKDGTENLIR